MSGLEMKYFVVKPNGTDAYAEASRRAIEAYADSIIEHNRPLAHDLIQWIIAEEKLANQKNQPTEDPAAD